jgi:DNA repair protein SbcC/Rad50
VRPLRLEMEGFTAFRERTVVDFDGVDLAALVGPTGSGKSSLIDAITFALYGAVARYENEKLVVPAINQLATEARVRFDFEVADTPHTAVRVARRTKAGATTKEARLESGAEVLASGPKELTATVADLLGLDFAQFTKTVVLPQGRFAAFLHDDPSDRQKLLRELLDLGVFARMGQQARIRAATAKAQLDVYRSQLVDAAGVSEERVAELAEWHRQVVEVRAEVGRRLERVVGLELEVDQVRARGEALVDALQRLRAVSVPERAIALGAELVEAITNAASAEVALAAARAERGAAQQAAEAGPDAARCNELLGGWERHTQLCDEVVELEGALSAATNAASAAAELVIAAQAVLEEADLVLDRARVAAGASAVVAALVVGEPCPVCRQTVATLPEHDLDAELAAATAQRDRARSALGEATKARDHARQGLATAEVHLERSRLDASELATRLAGAPDAAALTQDLELATVLAEALRVAGDVARQAEAAESEARSRRDELRTEEQGLWADYTTQRDGVITLDPPAPDVGQALIDGWVTLGEWASRYQDQVAAEAELVASRLGELDTELCAESAAIAASCAAVGLDGERDRLAERMAEAEARAEADVAQMRERLAAVARLRAEAERLEEQRQVAGLLGHHLRADGFERWLLAEVMTDLVERATDSLLTLSAGQYSMVTTGDGFAIRDHRNADEVRDVRTLSGGETFLASLALALALAGSVAEIAAEGAARLESMFLDEGFGTLDPETLDVVAAAIEELGASGRMVVIVTHIRELAERMPVRFEVSKGATTSAVERVEV